MAQKDDHQRGHRQRMKEKVKLRGISALSDHELLELLLYPLRPRIDTKPIVKALFAKFDSFAGMLYGTEADWHSVKGIGTETALHFQLIAEILDRLSFDRIKDRNIISHWQNLEFYCIQKLSFESTETFMMILLDNQNRVIDNVILGSGTVNQMTIYPREVLRQALAHNAVSVVLVHNHPSQDKRPSPQDIEMTAILKNTLLAAKITLHDHVIVAGGSCISLRNKGLIPD